MGQRLKIIRNTVNAIDVTGYLDYRQYLKDLYQQVKKAMPTSYSYIKFAVDLGYSATTVIHQIIQSKRNLTTKAGRELIKTLKLVGDQRQYFLHLINYNNSKNNEEREKLFQNLLGLKNRSLDLEEDKDQFEFYSEWYHPVIREMVALEGFKPDPFWIAKTIVPNIRPEQVKKSLLLLERLNFITHDKKKNSYKLVNQNIVSPREMHSMVVVRYHQRLVELGKESLTRIDAEKRDVSALTIQLSEENVAEIKKLIHKFHQDVLAVESKTKPGDQIYQINIQTFPFTGKICDD